jgi:uncharacterized RDD family membrane protein YckC
VTEVSAETATGFIKIYYSRKLQDYWIRRLVAIIIDAVIISIAVLILGGIIALIVALSTHSSFSTPWWIANGLAFPFYAGIPLFLYSALTEYYYGFTLGKRIMYLKVVKGEGKRPAINLALLRNATKIYWLALLLDVVVALAMPKRDPTQKYTDTFAGTMVVGVD